MSKKPIKNFDLTPEIIEGGGGDCNTPLLKSTSPGGVKAEKSLNFYQRFNLAKCELVGELEKVKGYNYEYFSKDVILPPILNLCVKHEFYTEINLSEWSIKVIDVFDKDNFVSYTLPDCFKDVKSAGITTGKGDKNTLAPAIKQCGGIATYSDRYLYLGVFGISAGDVVDMEDNVKPSMEDNVKPSMEDNVKPSKVTSKKQYLTPPDSKRVEESNKDEDDFDEDDFDEDDFDEDDVPKKIKNKNENDFNFGV